MTQKKLCAQLAVDKTAVSRWERGTFRPSVQAIKAIDKLHTRSARPGESILMDERLVDL